MSRETCRVFLPLADGTLTVLVLPLALVATSLFNDVPIPSDGSPKVLRFSGVWSNGDGVEVVVRRLPKIAAEVSCNRCGVSLIGVSPVESAIDQDKYSWFKRLCQGSAEYAEYCRVERRP